MKLTNKKFLYIVFAGVLIMHSHNQSSFSDIGIPSPSIIIKKSNTILVGNFEVEASKFTFHVSEVLKGPNLNGKRITVFEPSDLNYKDTVHTKEITLLLGDFKKSENIIFLKWFEASNWPHGHQFSIFPSESFKNCKNFITAVLEYDKKGKNVEDLVTTLLNDINNPNVYATLDFIDVILKDHTHEYDKELERQVVWCAFAQLLSKKQVDEYINKKLLILFPKLPASLSIPYFLELAMRSESLSTIIRLHVESLLRANELTQSTQSLEVNQLRDIYNKNKQIFCINDADVAIRMFDSRIISISELYADIVLELIVGKPLSELIGEMPPKDANLRKQLWQREIAKLD